MPDLSAWALVGAFTVEQAATLWCGCDPAKNSLTRPDSERTQIEPIKQMLSAAIESGELDADTSKNVFANIGNHSGSLVSRVALCDYAESKNQHPAFLFDTLLPENDVRTKAKNKGGRPPGYDWDAFIIEIIRVANSPDGLPDTQAKLIKHMQQWCQETWGNEPSDSVVKDRISKIYKGIGKGRKPVND